MAIVQCDDGMYYRDPMWYGSFEFHRWIVTVNKENELELSVEVDNRKFPKIGTLARKIVNNWPVTVKAGEYDTMGMFSPSWEASKRWRYVLIAQDVLPTPTEKKSMSSDVDLNDLKLCFRVAFPIIDVWNYFQEKPRILCGNLCDFLLGGFNSPFTKQVEVRSKLFKMYRAMATLSLESAIAKFGTKVIISKGKGKS